MWEIDMIRHSHSALMSTVLNFQWIPKCLLLRGQLTYESVPKSREPLTGEHRIGGGVFSTEDKFTEH